jgi:PII-like signaling protein
MNEHALVRSEEIAGEGKYEDIVEKLRENGALSACVLRTRNAYGSRLALDNFVMTDRDFEMLAVLGLYDMNTLEHSVRTFELAYRIITRPFTGDSGEAIVLGDFLERTDVSLEQFLRAALFHDIGKVIIPREVLHNALDDEEVLVKMFPEENLEAEEEHTKKMILQTLYANGIRPIDVVPLKEIFTGEKYTELLCGLEKRGFSETATLKDVIRMHEPEGKRILTSLGYQTEGELAGCHHNYEKGIYSHTLHTPYGTFGVADLIRIADVTDALRSARWYKKTLSPLEVLFVLVKDAEAGKIDSRLAYLWVKDQYAEFQEKKDDGSLALGEEERKEEVRAIEMFLEQHSRKT